MEKILVRGGKRLAGRVKISGAKNAALAILPAVLLASGKVSLSNIPDITDVRTMLRILEDLGMTIRRRGRNALDFHPSRLRGHTPPYNLVQKMRASSYLMGSLLARLGKATVPVPGGCDLGAASYRSAPQGVYRPGSKVRNRARLDQADGQEIDGGSYLS